MLRGGSLCCNHRIIHYYKRPWFYWQAVRYEGIRTGEIYIYRKKAGLFDQACSPCRYFVHCHPVRLYRLVQGKLTRCVK